jgi:hypothetical protein
MHTPSIRTLAALAYERGEEFDPTAALTPGLVEVLSMAEAARPIVSGPGIGGSRGRRERRTDATCVGAPDWFSPCDLVDPPIAGRPVAVVHGELL